MNPPNQAFNLEIVVQPAKEVRFRYARDHTSSIVGENNNRAERTYPTITTNYRGKIRVFVTLVDRQYRPHPHSLVGTNCTNGVCESEVTISDVTPNVEFSQLAIERAMISVFARAMSERQRHCYGDPFGRGYDPQTYDSIISHEVRLAFLAVVEDEENTRPNRFIGPIASNIIRDSKTSLQLKILHSYQSSGPATGGSQMILLTEKVNGDKRVNVMFKDPSIKWSAYADPVFMHKRVAFAATTPAYCYPGITESVFVMLSLVRDQEQRSFDPSVDTSDPVIFEYYPGPWGEGKAKQRDKNINPTIEKMFNQEDLERVAATQSELDRLKEAKSMSTEQQPYHFDQPHLVSTVQRTFLPPYQYPPAVQPQFEPLFQHSSTNVDRCNQQPFVSPYQNPSAVQQPFVPPYQNPSAVQQPFVPPYQNPSAVVQPFVPPYQNPSAVQQPFVPPYQNPSSVQQPFVPPYQNPSAVQQPFVPPYENPSAVVQPFVPPYQNPSAVQQPFVPPYQNPSSVQQPFVHPYQQPSAVTQSINQSYRVEPNSSPSQHPREHPYSIEPYAYSPTQSFEDSVEKLLNLEQSLATERTFSTERHPQEMVENHNCQLNPPPESIDDGVALAQITMSTLDLCDIEMISG